MLHRRELRKAGYQAKILKKIGFFLDELAEGDYTASELKTADYVPEELRAVGFTAGALRVAGFTSKQLRAARYTLREMQEGGFLWKDLGACMTPRRNHKALARAVPPQTYREVDKTARFQMSQSYSCELLTQSSPRQDTRASIRSTSCSCCTGRSMMRCTQSRPSSRCVRRSPWKALTLVR